jgi:hypothetical protein
MGVGYTHVGGHPVFCVVVGWLPLPSLVTVASSAIQRADPAKLVLGRDRGAKTFRTLS